MSIDEEEATIQTAEECCQQLGTMNGDPDHEAEHMDIQNKLDELIIMSMEPEDNNSNMTMCVHLGGPHCSDTDRISHDDGIETYLDTGDVGGCKDEANDFRCHTKSLKIKSWKHTSMWKHIGIGDTGVYMLQNAPIEALESMNQKMVFGQIENMHEGSNSDGNQARDVESKMTGNGNGKWNVDRDGIASCGSANLQRVKEAWLAEETCQHDRASMQDLQAVTAMQKAQRSTCKYQPDQGIDADKSNSHLETSARHGNTKQPT
ncbi:hypothetical protein J3A83DRAFT_4188048 [Scleroderma citrinum]